MMESFLKVTSTFIFSLGTSLDSIRIDSIDGSKYLMYSTGILSFVVSLFYSSYQFRR